MKGESVWVWGQEKAGWMSVWVGNTWARASQMLKAPAGILPDLRPILTCFVHPTLLFTVCKHSWQLSLICTNSNRPRVSQICCEIGWRRHRFLCRSKQQGLCTIWNLCTKSQGKAYKGDQSSYLPAICHSTWGRNTSDQLQTETCCLDNDPHRAWDPHGAGICHPGTGHLSIHSLRESFLL